MTFNKQSLCSVGFTHQHVLTRSDSVCTDEVKETCLRETESIWNMATCVKE